MLFLDCSGAMPGVNALLSAIGKKRGKEVVCSFNTISFTGILLDCNITAVSEPETMATFTANFGMIEHSLDSPEPKDPKC